MSLFSLSGLLTGVTCLTVGFWVYRSNPTGRVNRIWILFCTAVAIWGFGGLAIGYASTYQQALVAWRVAYVGVIFIPTVFYHFVVTFLDLKRTKELTFAYVASFSFLGFNVLKVLIPSVSKVFPDLYYLYPPGRIYTLFVLYFVFMVVVSHIALYRYIRSSKDQKRRRQAIWFLVSIGIASCGGVTCYLPVYGINIYPYGNFCIPVYPILMSYAIVKHQAMDIKFVIKKAAIYTMLVATITATYLVTVLVLERMFQGLFGYQSVVATVLVAFLIAIFFNPIRNKIQTLVDRSLFKATTVELAEQHEKLLLEVRKSEQQKAVATLAAGMAHEIKNPLTAIKTFTEHLPEKFDSEEFRAKFHKIVGGEVDRINHIVQQLLDFSKPVPPEMQPVNIPKLLDETLEFLNNDFIKRHIEVTKNYDGVSIIQGDPQQLKQVFLNLFLNSAQAMNGSGRLDINTSQTDSNLTVTIQDNGSGMSKEALDHLFEPFYTTKPTGTGLGLSVVKGIIDEHHGKVEVTSREHVGTQIKIKLPSTI